MSQPPDPYRGPSSADNWYPSPSNAGGPPLPPGPGDDGNPYGSPYGQPSAGAPYGQSSAGTPYGQPPAGTPYGTHPGGPAPTYPPQQNSGGGAAKWIVIGCLGCGGLAAIAFIALLLIGALAGDDSDPAAGPVSTSSQPVDPSASDDSAEAAVESAESEPSAADEDSESAPAEEGAGSTADPAAAASDGASAATESATLTVVSTERTQRLQDSVFEETTTDEFFVMHIEYVNTSDAEQTIWDSDFVLVDATGKEYSVSDDAFWAVENAIIIEDVNPDLTLQGTLVFEVPPGLEFTELRLEASFLTTESLTVPLS